MSMWWLILLGSILLYFLYINYNPTRSVPGITTITPQQNRIYQPETNQYDVKPSFPNQVGCGISVPRNYLIYANGNTIDPNNTVALLANLNEEPQPTLQYLQNEYNMLRNRSEYMELDSADLERFKRLQRMITNLQNDMVLANMTGNALVEDRALSKQFGGSRRQGQVGGVMIDARMGSDILTGTGSGPPINPPLGPLPGAPLGPSVSQLGVLKDSITNLLSTVYRIPEYLVGPDLGGHVEERAGANLTSYRPTYGQNRADPYYGVPSAANVSPVDLAKNLSQGTASLNTVVVNNSAGKDQIVNSAMQLAYMSQVLESRLTAYGNNDLSRRQALITNNLRAITADLSQADLQSRTSGIAQAQQSVYVMLTSMVPNVVPTVTPVATGMGTAAVITPNVVPVANVVPVVTPNVVPMDQQTKQKVVDAQQAAQRASQAQQTANDAAQRADDASQAAANHGSQQTREAANAAQAAQAAQVDAARAAQAAQQASTAAAVAKQEANDAVSQTPTVTTVIPVTNQMPPQGQIGQVPVTLVTPVTSVTPVTPITNVTPVAPVTSTPVAVTPGPPDSGNFARQPRTMPMPGYATNLSDQERWVRAHNFFRKLNCAPPVTWNLQLEQLAKSWAQKLAADPPQQGGMANIAHPSGDAQEQQYLTITGPDAAKDFGGRVGQNLAWGGPDIPPSGNNQGYQKEIEDVVADWYEEVNLPNFSSSGFSVQNGKISFTPISQRQSQIEQFYKQNSQALAGCAPGLGYKYSGPDNCNQGTGHFTQVVWKDTTQIGCAKVPHKTIPGTYVWSCDYNPPGNIGGEYQQNIGNPADC